MWWESIRPLALLVLLAVTFAGSNGSAESLEGMVSVGIDDLSLADIEPIVVYLVSESGHESAIESDLALPTIAVRQRGAQFEPRFLVVAAGQTVEMPNGDVIFHNVFSYSKPNDFDLGLYSAGQSRAVSFEHPGLVRIYCSIHEAMNGLIFVTPTRHHARLDSGGRFVIRNIPAGRYQVHLWSDRLPERVIPVHVKEGVVTSMEITLAPSASTD